MGAARATKVPSGKCSLHTHDPRSPAHTRARTRALSLSLTHTRTHARTRSRSHTLAHALSLSPSLTHTHTHTHTYAHHIYMYFRKYSTAFPVLLFCLFLGDGSARLFYNPDFNLAVHDLLQSLKERQCCADSALPMPENDSKEGVAAVQTHTSSLEHIAARLEVATAYADISLEHSCFCAGLLLPLDA